MMAFNAALRIHLAALDAGRSDFDDTLALIDRYFEFTPTAFRNGSITNAVGENEGSCRIFALGQLAGISEKETLSCFGRHYRNVMDDPAGTSHGNIRQFMTTGWSGIQFDGRPMRLRSATLTVPEITTTTRDTPTADDFTTQPTTDGDPR